MSNQTLSKIAKKNVPEAVALEVEAGYLNTELKLTEAGQLALLQCFYFDGGHELLTEMAKTKLAEAKAKEAEADQK